MAFQVSPGINISEIDLTTVTPAISTSTAAIAGVFSWGPVGRITQVSSEDQLVARHGKPTNDNFETFFVSAGFLAYSTSLLVSRAAVTTGFSNTATMDLNGNTTIITTGNAHGFAIGKGVYGAGIPSGATVTNATANATHSIVTISSAATLGNSSVASSQSVNFFDSS